MRVISLPCPHCKSPVRAAKSRTMSAMLKEITYQCQNVECGHTFVATLEVSRTVSMSAMPNPEVRIPISSRAFLAAKNQMTLDLATA